MTPKRGRRRIPSSAPSPSLLLLAAVAFCCVVIIQGDNPDFQCLSSSDCVGDEARCKMVVDVDLPKTFDRTGETLCQCPTGTGGDDCSATCSLSCQNGGSCRYQSHSSFEGTYGDEAYCDCRGTGHTGDNCELPFVACPNDVLCLYGGTCSSSSSSSSDPCQCPASRKGEYCQFDIDATPEQMEESAASSSQGGGVSINSGNGSSSYSSSSPSSAYSSNTPRGAVVGVVAGLFIVVLLSGYTSFKVIQKRRIKQQQDIETAKAAAATSDLELTDGDLKSDSPAATAAELT